MISADDEVLVTYHDGANELNDFRIVTKPTNQTFTVEELVLYTTFEALESTVVLDQEIFPSKVYTA